MRYSAKMLEHAQSDGKVQLPKEFNLRAIYSHIALFFDSFDHF